MDTELEHSSFVRRLISAAAILALSTFIFLPGTSAQINGVPASVTSIGFGGNFDRAPGPPASVTSLVFGGAFWPTFGPPAHVTSLGANGTSRTSIRPAANRAGFQGWSSGGDSELRGSGPDAL